MATSLVCKSHVQRCERNNQWIGTGTVPAMFCATGWRDLNVSGLWSLVTDAMNEYSRRSLTNANSRRYVPRRTLISSYLNRGHLVGSLVHLPKESQGRIQEIILCIHLSSCKSMTDSYHRSGHEYCPNRCDSRTRRAPNGSCSVSARLYPRVWRKKARADEMNEFRWYCVTALEVILQACNAALPIYILAHITFRVY